MSWLGAEANHDDVSDGEPRSPALNRAKSGFVSKSFHLVVPILRTLGGRVSRQLKNGKCTCWAKVDKELDKQGTTSELAQSFTFTGHHYLQVKTENKNKLRKSPTTVFASYCPFCGKKLKEPKK